MRVSNTGRDKYKGKEIMKIYLKPESLRRLKSMADHDGVEPWQVALQLMNDGIKWRKFNGGDV
jgi:hypothetical protein